MDTSEQYIKTPEHRLKLSLSMMGNKNQEKTHSPKTRAKISTSMLGNGNTKGHVHDATMRLRCSLAKLAEKNPLWLGGISFYPYPLEWTTHMRADIRIRDNHKCQICAFKSMITGELHVHHIDYDKRNNGFGNLITLCHSCHSKTNHHRTEWGILDGQFCRDEANVGLRYEGNPRVR